MIQEIKNFISQRKKTSGIIALALVLIGYFVFKSLNNTSGQVRYALATVQKGTLITSISGSGQVLASNQLDVTPKVSGDVIYVAVKAGQEIKAGTLLAQLDPSTAQKAVRDAQINLENAQISLSKLKLSQESNAPQLQDSITNTQNNLTQAYQSGFNEVANSFLDLPNILTGIRGILYDSTVGTTGQMNIGAYQNLINQADIMKLVSMINQAQTDYQTSSTEYDLNLDDYKNITRSSDSGKIISLINETLETSKTMAQSVKDEQNILDAVVSSLKQYQASRPIPSALTQYQSDIVGYISKLNSHINNLANIQNSITTDRQSLVNAQNSLDESQKSNPLDIQSQENTVEQRQAALQDAKDNLARTSIRAPFSGTVAKINVIKGNSVSNGTAVATMITPQQIAQLSLNEVDVAKINLGNKVTLTFSAVPDLTVAGQVLEIDPIGAVSQGVVSYTVKIGFDTQDSRIKPGMSVTANIITDVKVDVLIVPNSAVKTTAGNSYVQVANGLEANTPANGSASILLSIPPTQQQITVGSSNNSDTEIVSGLKEGDVVVVRTVTSTAKTTTSSTSTRSIFSTGGGARTGGGGIRGN